MSPEHRKLIEESYKEITTLSHKQIEIITSRKWASRAIATYLLLMRSNIPKTQLQLLGEAEDYFREAIEHAASSLESSLLTEIIQWVTPFKENANLFLLNS